MLGLAADNGFGVCLAMRSGILDNHHRGRMCIMTMVFLRVPDCVVVGKSPKTPLSLLRPRSVPKPIHPKSKP